MRDAGRHAGRALPTAVIVVLLVLAVAACGDSDPIFDDPQKPARTRPPAHDAQKIAWLGRRHGDLRFHSVDRHVRPLVRVNYGEPTPPDPGSGDTWHFALTVTTAPRRPQTRRRLQRSLGAGVPANLGIRYGCRHSTGPMRIAILTATRRYEIAGGECSALLRASRELRLA